MSTDWNQDSPEFILDHIRDAPEKQIQAIDTLDTKMIQIFVSASIVIGLAGLSSASGSERWEVVPLVLALLAYVSVAAVAIIHLWPRDIRWNLHADSLWPEYGKYDVEDIREVLAQDTRSLSEKQYSKRYASLVECKDVNNSTTKSRVL